VLLFGKLPRKRAMEPNCQENHSDDDVKAMKTRRHEKGRAIDRTFEREWRMGVFIGMDPGLVN
jgi:hypothetical protein